MIDKSQNFYRTAFKKLCRFKN